MDTEPVVSNEEIVAILKVIKSEHEKLALYNKIERAAIKSPGIVDAVLLSGVGIDVSTSGMIDRPSPTLRITSYRVLQTLIRRYSGKLEPSFTTNLLWVAKYQATPDVMVQALSTLEDACCKTPESIDFVHIDRFIKSATSFVPNATPEMLLHNNNMRATLGVVAASSEEMQDKIFDRLYLLSSSETFQTYEMLFSFNGDGDKRQVYKKSNVIATLKKCLSCASGADPQQGSSAHSAATAIITAYPDVARLVADEFTARLCDHADSAPRIRALSIIQENTVNEKFSVVSPATHRKIARLAREAKDPKIKEAAYHYWASIPAPFRRSMLKEMAVVLSYDAINHPHQMVRVAAIQCVYRVRDDDYGCSSMENGTKDPRQPLYSALEPYIALPTDRNKMRHAEILYKSLKGRDIEREDHAQECAQVRRAAAYLDRLAM